MIAKRLLCIEPGLRLWGSERALLATLPALVESYEKVVVLAPEGAELIPHATECGAVVETGRLGRLNEAGIARRVEAASRIVAICLKHGITRIYLNQAGWCRIVSVVARLLRLPLVIHVRLLADIGRCVALGGAQSSPIDLICVSHDVQRRLLEASTEVPRIRSYMAYDVVTVDKMPTMKRKRDPAAFACLGRIEPSKGQLELIDAFQSVFVTRRDARLILMGSVEGHLEYGRQVFEAAADTKVRGGVQLSGYVTDAPDRLTECSFLVIASQYETLGRTVPEAWNAGCIPICPAQSGGPAEILRLSGGGILYNRDEPGSLQTAMRSALDLDAQARAHMLENGLAFAQSQFSIGEYRSRLSGVLFPSSRGSVAGTYAGREISGA